VWLALEINTSTTVVALLGLSLGIPGLLFSLPAGAAADRLDKQKIIIYISLLGVFFLGMTSVLIQYEIINLPLALIVAFGTGSAISILIPVLQAMIPQLVPADRLMSAVGLKVAKRTPFFNAEFDCRLLRYELYVGSREVST